jgi:cytochrome d ubiquinol oxidase subunit I
VVGPAIAVTFALFFVVYGIIFSAGIYFINRLIATGLDAATTDQPAVRLGGALAAAGKDTGGGA